MDDKTFAKLKEVVSTSDPFMKLMDKMSEMQIEMMRHNWSDEERVDKAAAFRKELFDAIANYRDEWINRSK